MDMRSYIKPKKTLLIIGAGLILLAVLLCVMGAAEDEKEIPAALPMEIGQEVTDYCYIDVQALTDWTLSVTGDEEYTYYEAMDPEGIWHVVRLEDEEVAQLQHIMDYTYSEDENAVAPDPVRVYGVARIIPLDDREKLAEMYELTSEEYEGYFGDTFLEVGDEPSTGGGWYILAFMALIAGVIVAACYAPKKGEYKRCLRLLENSGMLEDAEIEFETSSELGNTIRYSDNFIYVQNGGKVMPFEDIVWVYRQVYRVYLVIKLTSLVIGFASGLKMKIKVGLRNQGDMEMLEELIAGRVPTVMQGFDTENVRAFNMMKREYMENNR